MERWFCAPPGREVRGLHFSWPKSFLPGAFCSFCLEYTCPRHSPAHHLHPPKLVNTHCPGLDQHSPAQPGLVVQSIPTAALCCITFSTTCCGLELMCGMFGVCLPHQHMRSERPTGTGPGRGAAQEASAVHMSARWRQLLAGTEYPVRKMCKDSGALVSQGSPSWLLHSSC